MLSVGAGPAAIRRTQRAVHGGDILPQRQAPARGGVPGSLAARVLAGFAVTAALVTLVAALTRDVTAVFLCATALGVFLVLLVTVANRRNFDLFEPLSFVILAATLGTGAKAIYVAFSTSEHIRSEILLNQPREVLLVGCVYILLGISALCLGYSFKLPRFDFSRTRVIRRCHWDRRVLTLMIGFILLAALSAFAVWFRRMGVSTDTLVALSQKRFLAVEGSEYRTSLGYLSWGMSLAQIAFYLLLSWRLLARHKMPLFATIALPVAGFIALAFPVMSSSREGIMEVILIAIIITHYLRSGIPYRLMAMVVPPALLAFLAVTAARGSRETEDAADKLTGETFLETTIAGRHFMDVAKTSHIIEASPDKLPRAGGETFITWLVAPIPRSLWPDKPAVGAGVLVGSVVYGLHTSGVPPGFVAELYMNFGPIAVPLGMFLLGVMLRWLYAHFALVRRNPNAIVLYAMTVIPLAFILLEGSFSRVILIILRGALPATLLLLAFGRPRSSPTTI